MPDHYRRGVDHPIIDVPGEPPAALLDEMDAIAGELRANAKHNEADDAIAFRQLQCARRPDLSNEEYLDLFDLWSDRYRSGVVATRRDRDSRMARLRTRLDGELLAKGREVVSGAVAHRRPRNSRAHGVPDIAKRIGSLYRSGRSKYWLKVKNPAAPAVQREAEEDWGR